MSKRRKSREVALQFLYQLDLHSEADPSRHGAEFWERHPVDADTRAPEEIQRCLPAKHSEDRVIRNLDRLFL